MTGSEYRQLEGFTRRDWSRMPVNYVWIGDGHGMKLKCAHPVHGRPFAPEVTFVIDGGTRFVVGWSLDTAENVFAVAGAIQHGIRHHGKPFLYYSDNGSGKPPTSRIRRLWGYCRDWGLITRPGLPVIRRDEALSNGLTAHYRCA